MNASDLMTKAVQFCNASDTAQRAAQLMWENDCGVVPVVDGERRVIGMVTDRDIAMSAYTRGQPLWQIPVYAAMAKQVHGVREDDSIEAVETLMRRVRVRRVPVLDTEGRLKGILSMNDLARHAQRDAPRSSRKSDAPKGDGLRPENIVSTLAAVCEPHSAAPVAKEPKAAASRRNAQLSA